MINSILYYFIQMMKLKGNIFYLLGLQIENKLIIISNNNNDYDYDNDNNDL